MNIAVIGGGAAGMIAAVTAADRGARVTLYEGGKAPGRKILATGSGRCNLTNLKVSESCWHSTSPEKIIPCLTAFPPEETIRFFLRLGVPCSSEAGYIYPASRQASSVRDSLVAAMERKKVRLHCNSRITEIVPLPEDTGFELVHENGYRAKADRVILACGGKSMPATGSDGSGYELARRLGHKILPPVPALTSLNCRDKFFRTLHGVRVRAQVTLLIDGAEYGCETGEVQLTQNGVSGIPVFQLSFAAARSLQQGKKTELCLNLDPAHGAAYGQSAVKSKQTTEEPFPDSRAAGGKRGLYAGTAAVSSPYADRSIRDAFRESMAADGSIPLRIFLHGFYPEKLGDALMQRCNLKPAAPIGELTETDLDRLFRGICSLRFPVTGTGDFEQAQVTSGGILLAEVNPETMESEICPGLYLAGEILDVDGICGGYNLQWAWSSGYSAGIHAAESI